MLIGLGGVRMSTLINMVENTILRGQVRAAAIADVTISTLNNGDSLDGLTLATGDLVLLTGQTDASENGVYLIDASEGSTVRWVSFNVAEEVTIGSVFLVGEGTVYAESIWMMVTGGDIVVDTTNLTFSRVDESRAEGTVPTEVADGAHVRPLRDRSGREIPPGYNRSQGVMDVQNIGGAPATPITVAAAQLTEAGSTAPQDVSLYKHITFEFIVAAINISVDVRAEGSFDKTNWFNLDDDEVDEQKTANGTFIFHKSNFKCKYVRFTFVTEDGGTAVTINVTLMAGN